jgi:hypothetical protein
MAPRWLPRFYLEGFRDPDAAGDPALWVYRAPTGQWRETRLDGRDSADRDFNAVSDPALAGGPDPEERFAAEASDLSALLREALPAGRALGAAERALLARFFAFLGVRRAPRSARMAEAEAAAGEEALARVLEEMGWVIWRAGGGGWFVTSSSPFLVSFPQQAADFVGTLDIQTPSSEVTLPLTRDLALLGTWKRRGTLWRTAPEEALLELNFRTCTRALAFLASPRPAVPG